MVKLDDAFFCPGYKIVEDRRIRCARTTGHGAETFETGIMNSCKHVFENRGQYEVWEQTLEEIGVDFAVGTSYNKRKREVRKLKTEKQLNNSIYLMNIITELYMKKHKLSTEEF